VAPADEARSVNQVAQRGRERGDLLREPFGAANEAQIPLDVSHVGVSGCLAKLSFDTASLLGVTSDDDHAMVGAREAPRDLLADPVRAAGHKSTGHRSRASGRLAGHTLETRQVAAA